MSCTKTGTNRPTRISAQRKPFPSRRRQPMAVPLSAMTNSAPYTVPSWLTLSPVPGSIVGPASTTATTFTIAPTTGCGGFNAPSVNYATLHLANAPGPDKLIPVTLNVVASSVLTATPTPSSGALTYIKGSGTPGYVDVAVTSATTPAPFFAVDSTSLPIWLNVDSTSGTVPKSIRFSSNTLSPTPWLQETTAPPSTSRSRATSRRR